MGFEENFNAGETIEILRATRTEDPYSGELGAPDWSSGGEVIKRFFHSEPPYVPILPNSSAVDPEKPDVLSPEYREDDLVAFFPYRTDIDEDDRVRIMSGKYVREQPYEIASVKFYKNPFDGEEVIAIAVLKWQEG